MRLAPILAAFVASGAAQQQTLWGQCGGVGWTGPTQCVAGATCLLINEYYSQCAPGTTSAAAVTPTTTTSKASSQAALTNSKSSTPAAPTTTKASAPAAATTTQVSAATAASTGVTAPQAPASRLRVALNPDSVRAVDDGDFQLWSLGSAAAPSKTFGKVTFSLSIPTTAKWRGGWFKFGYSKFLSSMGERLINQGLSTETGGSAITLSITGLAAGKHSLLSWHNAWDKLAAVATLTVSVNGAQAASGVKQTVRVDNIWEAGTSSVTFDVTSTTQTVQIRYTPSSQGDARAFLNGFELDGPAAGDRIKFPSPEHRNERVILNKGSVVASWRAPTTASSPRYDVYLGTAPTTLRSVSLGQTSTQVTLSGLNTVGTYYWRVDVVSGGVVNIGQVFMFRAAQLAFPGAEGWGRYSRGGRGGKVVKVTSLADGTSPGTLRHALTVETGPRTVVFDVGGVITLTSRLTLNGQYVTVAGQTAPGKGIIIQGMPFGLSGASDVIIQHVRVRPGKVSGQTVDGMGAQGSNHCIFDRCSVGWSIDEAFSSRSAHNITFQRNMISEPLNVAGHQNYPAGTGHGYAATIGGDVGSFHHNLIAHAEGRSWSMGGGLDANNEFAGRLDIRNNVVYNFGGRVTDGGAKAVNFVGNLYKRGPASQLTYALKATYEDNFGGAQQYHCAGNSMPGVFTQTSAQYPSGDGTSVKSNIACFAEVSYSPAPTYQRFFPTPFFESHVETQSSTEAYKRVLSDSGASQPVFDDHDKRIVRETLAGTTTYVGSASGKKGLIDHPNDAGGLESFPTTTRPANWDANNDGIADWWDGSTGGEGYTALEGYLNFMAEPHAFVKPSAAVSIDLAALASGFTKPTFKVSGATKGTVSVSGTSAKYQAGAAAGIDYFDIAIQDTEGSTWTRKFGVAITA